MLSVSSCAVLLAWPLLCIGATAHLNVWRRSELPRRNYDVLTSKEEATLRRRVQEDGAPPPPLSFCKFYGLRHILAASAPAPNQGLRRCSSCTFDYPGCTVYCASCLDANDDPTPGEVSLELSNCLPSYGNIMTDSEGILTCSTAPAPPDGARVSPPPPEPPAYPPQPSPPPPAVQTDITGTVEAYTSHWHNDDRRTAPEMSYSVVFTNEATGNSTRSSFSLGGLSDMADVQTGDRITFAVSTPGAGRRLLSDCDEITGLCFDPTAGSTNLTASGKDFVVDGKPVNITSIVMLARVCNTQPLISLQKLRSTLFNADQSAPSRNVTLQHYYSTCSYGKVSFTPANNLVAQVDLPCTALYQTSATGKQTFYDSVNSCEAPELYGWMRDALAKATASLGLSSTAAYKRKVLFLPNRRNCGWPGLASVGCDSSCNTWINQFSPNNVDMQVLFQELGHNIGLQHANRWINGVNEEYEDFTDPMGVGWTDNDDYQNKTLICLGAAEAFKAGWTSPVRKFNLVENLVAGVPTAVTMPSMHVSDTNFIYLNATTLPSFKPSWPSNAAQLNRTYQLFISYRVKQPAPGFDSGLADEMSKKVYIHNYNATQRIPPRPDPSDAAMKSSLIAILGTRPGTVRDMTVVTSYRFNFGPLAGSATPVNGIRITPIALTDTAATVTLCYFTVASERDRDGGCSNTIDDDCDGLVDADDPDCGVSSPPPPPPPPRPSPPRPSPPPPPRSPPTARSPPPRSPPKPRRPPPKPPAAAGRRRQAVTTDTYRA